MKQDDCLKGYCVMEGLEKKTNKQKTPNPYRVLYRFLPISYRFEGISCVLRAAGQVF